MTRPTRSAEALDVKRGSLYLASANALSQSNALSFDPSSGKNARLFLYGNNLTVSSLSSSGAGTVTIANGNVSSGASTSLAAATLTVNQSGNTTFSGLLEDEQLEDYKSGNKTQGSLSLIKSGSGTLTLTDANTYSGSTTVSAGNLTFSNVAVPSTSIVIAAGATLQYDDSSAVSQVATTLTGAGTLLKTSGGTLTFGGNIGPINWQFSAGAVIDVEGGDLVGGNNQEDNWTNNQSNLIIGQTSQTATAMFEGVEANVRVDKLSGYGTLFTGYNTASYSTFTIGVNNGSSEFDGPIEDDYSAGNITKAGTGTLTLTGDDTYSGGTTIAAGTLLVTGELAGPITIDSNATLDDQVNSNGDSGAGTLRQALTNSNEASGPGTNTITFNIAGAGVHVIAPASQLPAVTASVVINGYSQSGASVNTQTVGDNANLQIELNGGGLANDGLDIDANNTTVEGLDIANFGVEGMWLLGSGINIQGNFIGTNPTGTTKLANGGDGILTGSGNTIGGTTPASRNIISGSGLTGTGSRGVEIEGYNTIVEGNYIGTDASGTISLSNLGSGVYVGLGTNTIGGATAGAGNLISGNGTYGIRIINGSNSNLVEGNYIGTNATGAGPLANSIYGVYVSGGINNTIGGTTGTIGALGTAAFAGNLISGNTSDGVNITSSTSPAGNVLEGNEIGTNAAGSPTLANGGNGVTINGSSGNTIGGTAAGAGNLIAPNSGDGVLMSDAGGTLVMAGNSAMTGSVVISSGTIQIASYNALGSSPVTLNDVNTGANNTALLATVSASAENGTPIANSITVANLGTGTTTLGTTYFVASPVSSTTATSFTGNIALQKAVTFQGGNSDRTTYDGVISSTGSVNITVTTASGSPGGRTTFGTDGNPANTFTGSIAISGQGTELEAGNGAGSSSTIPATTEVNVGTGASLTIFASSETIDALSGSGAVNNAGVSSTTLTIGANNGSATYGGVMQNGSGPITLVKTGSGTETLTASNTYTGGTTINGGTLLVTGSLAGTIAINSGTLNDQVIITSDSGLGSLRQAITNANAASGAGTNTITFAIPAAGEQHIEPMSALPTIVQPVVINGYTQSYGQTSALANSDAPNAADNEVVLIQLNGSLAPSGTNGLTINAGATVEGLDIGDFTGAGIDVEGAGAWIKGDFIGTDQNGFSLLPNSNDGILVTGSNNVIGGLTDDAQPHFGQQCKHQRPGRGNQRLSDRERRSGQPHWHGPGRQLPPGQRRRWRLRRVSLEHHWRRRGRRRQRHLRQRQLWNPIDQQRGRQPRAGQFHWDRRHGIGGRGKPQQRRVRGQHVRYQQYNRRHDRNHRPTGQRCVRRQRRLRQRGGRHADCRPVRHARRGQLRWPRRRWSDTNAKRRLGDPGLRFTQQCNRRQRRRRWQCRLR